MSKIKELADKSPMELEAWEINSLQQIALEQEKEIESLKELLKKANESRYNLGEGM